MVFDCFAVHWGDVMFRLTGWNKVDEILYLLFGSTAPSSGLHWTRQSDVTKAFYSKAHNVQKNYERQQTWTRLI